METSGYAGSFPNLVGTINSFDGDEVALGKLRRRVEGQGDWLGLLSPTEVGLGSAACHSLYPMLRDSTIREDGSFFEIQAYCFRHEPSAEPTRMQSFRQHEYVVVGSPEVALSHRESWLARARALFTSLGLQTEIVEAHDPFFGRAGRLLAAGQKEKNLKFEVTSTIYSETPTAIASANYHEDHFGSAFNLKLVNGSVAHSACFGFGMERVALALYSQHGFDVNDWPIDVRRRIGIRRDGTSPEEE